MSFVDLTGMKFGRLTVVGRAENYVLPSSGKKRSQWVCECECGNKRGETHTISEWANIIGISYNCLLRRYKAGWSVKDISTLPKKRGVRNE